MPRLWTETIEEHRDAVREAVLDAAGELVDQVGLTGVTMSAIAERGGIGRATLYKYFHDVEAILGAWHERHVDRHLRELTEVAEAHDRPGHRFRAVLDAYARIIRMSAQHGDGLLVARLHRSTSAHRAQLQLREMLALILKEAANVGDVRRDIPPGELAGYALAALDGAGGLSAPAAQRLVDLVVAGLQGPSVAGGQVR